MLVFAYICSLGLPEGGQYIYVNDLQVEDRRILGIC